jgi:hypothetical protein
MFQVAVKPFDEDYQHPANAAYVPQRSGIDLNVSVDVTNRQRVVAFLVWIALPLALVLLAHMEIIRDFRWPATIGLLCAGIGPIILVVARHVISIRVYLTQPGALPPLIDESGAGRPYTPGSWRSLILEPLAESPVLRAIGFFPLARDPYVFHVFVRGTEPQAIARFTGMFEDSLRRASLSRKVIIRFRDLEKGVRDFFLHNRVPTEHSRALAISASKHNTYKRDLWPLVRLCIGRTLYPRPKSKDHDRALGEEAKVPEGRGDHARFTFRFHLVPLAYWFLIVGGAILIPSVIECKEFQQLALRAYLAAPLLWAIWALYFHTSSVQRWRRWVEECGTRPMGRLPLFLYCPQNDLAYRWEELDEFDFDDHIDQYSLHTKQMFEIIVATFAFAIVGLLEVIGNTLVG